MKLEFNWGTGIAIFYSLFMIAMISMVIKSTHHKAHLVEENYYDKDLNYESFRIKRQNAANLPQPLVIYANQKKEIQLTFPKEMNTISGQVALFRPSDKNKDQIYPITLNPSKQMFLNLPDNTALGKWYIQVEWESDGKGYYQEQIIIL